MNFMYPDIADPRDWIWDEETYPNIYTAAFRNPKTGQQYLFEISTRRNDVVQLMDFVEAISDYKSRFVGFNSIGFDYPVLHYIMEKGIAVAVSEIYEKAMSIINGHYNQRFRHIIRDHDCIVEQVDLFKIHHFDNVSRATSLKTLEINMGMDRVEDLPFPVGTILTDAQMDVLIVYNWYDINATEMFYFETLPAIKFREELTEKYGKNFINHNDGKIGKDFFIMKLEEAVPGCCYDMTSGKRVIRQTKREYVDLGDVIFDYVQLEHPEFQRMVAWFRSQRITETKGVFEDINCIVDGFQYDFGLGGIHGSITATTVTSDEEYQLVDVDVASYYPRIPMKTRMKPEHLPEIFCDIYTEVYEERRKYKKGTPENAMLKLALNSVYGDSNSKYSPFYDTKYTMGTTVNGQLMLCMLAEQLIKIPGLTMIQVNTDGMTVKCPRGYLEHLRSVCGWWEGVTQLELEEVLYSRMMILNVNNYIAEYEGGGLKRKGTYCYGDDFDWNQNFSSQVIAKAAEAALVDGQDVEDFIRNHSDISDFMINTKVPRSAALALSVEGLDVPVPNIVRYVVTTDGKPLNKIMPPAGPEGQFKRANGLTDAIYQEVIDEIGQGVWDERVHTKNKSVYSTRRGAVEAGFLVTICNDIQMLNGLSINYDYYINKANKLVLPLRGE